MADERAEEEDNLNDIMGNQLQLLPGNGAPQRGTGLPAGSHRGSVRLPVLLTAS